MTTTADDSADESRIFVAIESFAAIHDGQPVTVGRGGRFRGGEGSIPHRFNKWFLADGALDSEVFAARERAGLTSG